MNFKRVDWEITLDGETYSGCFNLHKPADLETIMSEVKQEVEVQMETADDDA